MMNVEQSYYTTTLGKAYPGDSLDMMPPSTRP